MSRPGAAGCLAALIAMWCAVLPFAADTAGAAVATAEPCVSSQMLPVPGSASDVAGSVPVVFIHGIISRARIWHASSPDTIAGKTACRGSVSPWTFNYGPGSLDWVNDRAIGPALAACRTSASAPLGSSKRLLVKVEVHHPRLDQLAVRKSLGRQLN